MSFVIPDDQEAVQEASPSESQEIVSAPTFHGFERLPIEIRRIIYAMSLIRGKIYITLSRSTDQKFTPPETTWSPSHDRCGELTRHYEDLYEHENQGITVGLLQGVSKATQREAEKVFYSARNHFVVPVGVFEYPIDIGGIPGPVFRLCQYRSISYSFDMRQVGADHYSTYLDVKEEYGFHNGNFDHLAPDVKRSALHDRQKEDILESWEEMCETITEKLVLQFLQLDFENCYCPVGCCRMVEDVCKLLVNFPNGFPKRVEVFGLRRGSDERELVQNLIGKEDGGCIELV